MVLVDTSVWIEFLRKGNSLLEDLLEQGEASTHPLVLGELSIGNIQNRKKFLSLLRDLSQVQECSHEEVLNFIEAHRIHGKGIGYFDAHILASSVLSGIPLWTLDRSLAKLAGALASRWSKRR